MEHILILNACCIIYQKLKVVEVEDVQEDSNPEPESDADPYGSLEGGSQRNFLGDEWNKNGDDKDDDPKDDDPEPRSLNIDIKSAKRARISHIVIYQLRVTYGVGQTKILESHCNTRTYNQQVMWLRVFYSARCRMPGGKSSNLTKMVTNAMFTSRCGTEIW
jgi:hypothetical protein